MVPWYTSLFGEEFLRVYGLFVSDERTAQEVEHIVQRLALPPRSEILDLACGHGRHAIPLAELGYRVTGFDLSEVFLARARADAASRSAPVSWVHGDMRDIPFENAFDAVINIFTAFGYFDDDSDNQLVLRQVHKALRPGGRFLIDTMHRDALVRRFQPFGITRHDDGLIVTEERRFDQMTGRNAVRITLLYPDGTRKELGHDERVYTLTELAAMLHDAGLSVEAVYGGLDGGELTLESRRLVVIARKPEGS